MEKPSTFRVVICGGGIAGLTLANCLQHANIDYILLEARDTIAPQVGASIGMFSHGGRILDQLGVLDEMAERCEPLVYANTWKDGKLIAKRDMPQLMTSRTGYPILFGDRQMVLQILYDRIHVKSKVLLGKRVLKIDDSEDAATVFCKDGSTYKGDIVVGADGVHSIVRHEMWRIANTVKPGTITEKEQNCMIAEYSCVYGISNDCGLRHGETYMIYGDGRSALVICGKDGRTFWFFFEKMDKTYKAPDIPKFTQEDAERQMEKNLRFEVNDSVDMGDLWRTRVSFTLVALEEALFKTWSWGRLTCVGDSIHKMTPNVGQGGNSAVESAAAVANNLKRLMTNSGSTKPSYSDVKSTLKNYEKTREVRIKGIVKMANMMTRLESLAGLHYRLLALYIAPNAGDLLVNLSNNNSIGAEKVEYLPDTERSFKATMPFNRLRGIGHEESTILRALIALPLLPIGWFCHVALKTTASSPTLISELTDMLTNGTIPGTTSTLASSYYGPFSFLESTFRMLVGLFSPFLLNTDTAGHDQVLSFLIDLAPVYLIFVLESYRRANTVAFARFPVVFALIAQLYGIGYIGPIYYFLHYVQSPLSKYSARDQRLVNMGYVKTALPTLIIAYLLPGYMSFYASTDSARLSWHAIWQIFPPLVTLTHYILTTLFVKDTTSSVRLEPNPTSDMPYIRFAMYALIALSATAFNYIRLTSPFSLPALLFPTLPAPLATLFSSPSDFFAPLTRLNLITGMNYLLKTDYMCCFASTYLWLGLLFHDLKRDEMLFASWMRIICLAALGTLAVGPGAVIAVGWMVREEILTVGNSKGAVVRGKKV